MCQKPIPTEELDDHVLEHIPKDEEPTGQAVSGFFLFFTLMFSFFYFNNVNGIYAERLVQKMTRNFVDFLAIFGI